MKLCEACPTLHPRLATRSLHYAEHWPRRYLCEDHFKHEPRHKLLVSVVDLRENDDAPARAPATLGI